MSRPFAIIVDIDATICTQFDVPIKAALEVLQRIDERKLPVHYVTARPEVCGTATALLIFPRSALAERA
jgi:ribonucleotide monophosphatase NagD (HAD superfamily)